MKKFFLATYIFFCTGGTYAQQRQDTVVAEIDFNRPPTCFFCKADTIRATLLITRGSMQYAHSYEGYAVIGWLPTGPENKVKWDTVYLDDRMRPLKAPVTIWKAQLKNQ